MWNPHKLCLIVIVAIGLIGIGTHYGRAQETDLIGLLVQRLGVTQLQAEGGAGAIFGLAQQKLAPAEFGQISAAVPNMDELLAAAPEPTGSLGGLLGEGTSMFGGTSQKVEGMAGLAGSFSQLGLSPDMVGQFSQIILSFVQSSGGDTARNLLAAVLQ